MPAPGKGFRSLKELGVQRTPPATAGVAQANVAQTFAEKAQSLRDTATRLQIAGAQNGGLTTTDPSTGDSVAEDLLGVSNPFGSSTRAFEPNTEFLDMYEDAWGSVQDSKAKEQAESAAATNAATAGATTGAAAGSSVARTRTAGSTGTGIYNAQGRTQAILNAAMGMVGKMYVWGGTTSSGVDCSGLIYYALQAAGVEGARRYRAVDYSRLGSQVSAQDARPGDIVYIDNPNSDTDHVGIYIGNGQMIESPTSGQRTKVSNVGNRATSYRRILNDDSIGRSQTASGTTTWLYNGATWNTSARWNPSLGNGPNRRI